MHSNVEFLLLSPIRHLWIMIINNMLTNCLMIETVCESIKIDYIKIDAYTDEDFEFEKKSYIVGIDGYGDYSCSINRIKCEFLSKELFQKCIYFSRHQIKNLMSDGNFEERLNALDLCSIKKQTQLRYFHSSEHQQYFDTNSVFRPANFSALLNIVGLYISVYHGEDEIRDPVLRDEHYNVINYKKMFAQHIFGNVKWSDFSDFELIAHDGNHGYCYFQLNNYHYSIKMHTS